MRKIVDEQSDSGKVRLSTQVVCDTIKRSNSSLNRKPRKLLEDSIDRVLEVFQNDVLAGGESDTPEGDFEGLGEENGNVVVSLSLALYI